MGKAMVSQQRLRSSSTGSRSQENFLQSTRGESTQRFSAEIQGFGHEFRYGHKARIKYFVHRSYPVFHKTRPEHQGYNTQGTRNITIMNIIKRACIPT
jgi:hypothetical protein